MGKSADPGIDLVDIADAKVRRRLNRLCTNAREEIEKRDTADATAKAIMAQVKELAEEHGLTKVKGPGWLMLKTRGGRKDINGELLLEHGVAQPVIDAATVKKSWDSYQVRRANGGAK